MSDYERCPKCHQYGWVKTHTCKPFEACVDWSPDTAPWSRQPREDEWTDARSAGDAEDAAEHFCERYDADGDYTIVSRGSGRVWIRDEEGVVTRWTISAESVPQYHAYAAK